MDLILTASLSSDMEYMLPPMSKCVLLFSLYPEPLSSRIRLFLVLPSEEPPESLSSSTPFEDFGFASVQIINRTQMSKKLSSNVSPPVLCCSDRRLVWVGFPSTIRALVSISCSEGSKDGLKLLGLHKACLKACKEVSKWTMFCEVTLPRAMAQAVTTPGLTPTPAVLLEMQGAFHRDPPIHNRNKHRAEEKSSIGKEEFRRRLPGTHRYLEGPRTTLVDIVAFFYVWEATRSRMEVKDQVERIAEMRQWKFYMMKINRLVEALQRLETIKIHWSDSLCTSADESFSSIVDGIDKMKLSDDPRGPSLASVVSSFSHLGWERTNVDDTLADRWTSFPDFVNPRDGDVPLKRLNRKCQQLGSIVSSVLSIAQPGDVIVDFCSGAGHVGLLLAFLLPQCQVILLENKEESLVRAEARIGRSGSQLSNVHLFKCNLTEFRSSHFHIGVALHACGSATDLVMDACVRAKASFVVSPCCYGAIKPNASVGRFPRSVVFRDSNCVEVRFAQLRHGADSSKDEACREAMRLVDSDRLWKAKETEIYKSLMMMQMTPPECSPKNHILIGKMRE